MLQKDDPGNAKQPGQVTLVGLFQSRCWIVNCYGNSDPIGAIV